METPEDIGAISALVTDLGLRLLVAVVIFLVGRWAAQMITKQVRRFMAKADIEDTLEQFLGNLLYALLLTFVIIATINQLGVQTTSLIAVLGAAGLAVGLALQGSLSNFAAGVLLVAFRPYKVGDFIDGGGVSGTVHEMQIFTTVLRSPDNKTVIVPNSQMMNGHIVNYSANDTRRIDLVAGCGYSDDLDKVRSVLEKIVADEKRVLDDPEPTIGVSELGDSSVNFVVRPWVNTSDYWPVYLALTEQIKKRFDKEGISIPFPQRDVHLYKHDAD
jgi:small conductance mechanosensitive channel